MTSSAHAFKSIASLGRVVTGATPPSRNPEWFAESGVAFLTPSDIDGASRSVDTVRHLSEAGRHALSKRLLPPRAVCFVCIGSTIGKMCMTVEETVTNQQINSIIVDPTIANPTFIYYSLRARSDEIRLIAGGSATPIINKSAFEQLKIPLLPLDRQEAVGAMLDALDAKIESNRRAIGLASQLLDAMATKVASELPLRKLSELVEAPKETVNPSVLKAGHVDHYSLPAFDQSGRPERVAPGVIMSNKTIVPGRSILLSRLNPRINRTWWVTPVENVLALCSMEFLCMTAKCDADLAGVWLVLRTREFQTELPQRVTGTSGSHQRVRPQDVLSIEVPDVSKLSDATRQAALSLLESSEQRGEEIARLAALRDVLLPELLAGRLGVPDAEEALAEVDA